MRDDMKYWRLALLLFCVVLTLGYGALRTHTPSPPCSGTSVFCAPETPLPCQPVVCQDAANS
ncbi:MAG: hypothetical protein OXN25_11260 [Candidatus Poribacteria bacterium]|nr:hypothetical protein [Candidatus Poribacteria bacterium]